MNPEKPRRSRSAAPLCALLLAWGAGCESPSGEERRESPENREARTAAPVPPPLRYSGTAYDLAGETKLPDRKDQELPGLHHVYVTLQSKDAVAALEPDLQALARLPDVLGVNCFAGDGREWKTRMFAPGGGVPEDPATGSAAGPLACHLARHGRISFGEQIEISQGAEIKRPSTLYARVSGSGAQIEKVEVGGSAVVVARGEFRLD